VEPVTSTTSRGPIIATVGFQGFGNVGDEAILTGIETMLGGRATVRTIFTGGLAAVVAFPAARRMRTWRLLPTPVAIRELRGVDALVIGGGGLVNDYWPAVIPRYLLWCLAARLAGARVVWVGAGVGPIRRGAWRSAAGLAFRVSNLVTVRDEASAGWVVACLPSAGVHEIPDPAFFNPRPPRRVGAGVGIVARGPGPRDAGRSAQLADSLVGVIGELRRRGEAVEVIAMHPPEDEPFLALMRERLEGAGLAEIQLVSLAPDPAGAISRLATFDRLISVRLHGLILGALAGVPAVTIAYDDKVGSAARAIGLAGISLGLADATPDALLAALDRSADAGLRATMDTHVAELQARSAEVAELVLDAVR
jgi:polysaccharide pyruvyl transferase WcaK-like protein